MGSNAGGELDFGRINLDSKHTSLTKQLYGLSKKCSISEHHFPHLWEGDKNSLEVSFVD